MQDDRPCVLRPWMYPSFGESMRGDAAQLHRVMPAAQFGRRVWELRLNWARDERRGNRGGKQVETQALQGPHGRQSTLWCVYPTLAHISAFVLSCGAVSARPLPPAPRLCVSVFREFWTRGLRRSAGRHQETERGRRDSTARGIQVRAWQWQSVCGSRSAAAAQEHRSVFPVHELPPTFLRFT